MIISSTICKMKMHMALKATMLSTKGTFNRVMKILRNLMRMRRNNGIERCSKSSKKKWNVKIKELNEE